MLISQLIRGLPIKLARGGADAAITEIVEDSRLASPGCLFIARPGVKADGRKFIADAVASGAVAVLADDAAAVPAGVACLVAEDVPLASAQAAERFYGGPSRELQLIGITGTNGKTTTAYLIRHLLNAAGIKCGLIGTVQIDDGVSSFAANLTTPPAIELSRLMRAMRANGCRACVMETSSHALHQKRTAGLSFKAGVFTNLTGDHLDYHQTMAAYADAKAILFRSLPADGWAIVNVDDQASRTMTAETAATIIECSPSGKPAECRAIAGRQTLSSIETTFFGPWGGSQESFRCDLPLIGLHNVANALQALAVASCLGVDAATLKRAIATCKAPPGRLEPVTSPDDPFAVLVDYAHTDDALENVLRALKPVAASGKLRVVFGCGGDRDRTKRPRMARVACSYADDVVVTSDNPRTESPQAILDEIMQGVPAAKRSSTPAIVDRAEAIHLAVGRTRPGDILLIAGKGHEDYQIIGTTKRPFDDRQVAAAALAGARVSAGAA